MPSVSLPVLTERLVVRALEPRDLESLLVIQSRPDVARYLYWEPRAREEVRRWLKRAMPIPSGEVANEALTLAAEERSSRQLAGTVSLFLRSLEHRQGEIGFMFHPDFQGRGLATEGARVVLEIGFAQLGLHRIFGQCDGRNRASASLMERLGMRLEARLIENEWVKSEWTDAWTYAILASEWRQQVIPPR
ncbi:MAG TPA: GNAT family N-acetyltransferase [Candidatus Dormibacteraeota bacterium]